MASGAQGLRLRAPGSKAREQGLPHGDKAGTTSHISTLPGTWGSQWGTRPEAKHWVKTIWVLSFGVLYQGLGPPKTTGYEAGVIPPLACQMYPYLS